MVANVAGDRGGLDALDRWLRDRLRARYEALRAHPEPRAELEVLLASARTTEASSPPVPPAVAAIGALLELRPDEQRVVAVLLACAVAPELGRSLGLLCDPLARDHVTREALASVLGMPRTHRFTAEDALVRWSVTTEIAGHLALDPTLEARLLGRPCRDPVLVERVAMIPERPAFPGWPVDPLVARARDAIAAGARGVRIWVRGPAGSGRRTLFASVARALELTAVEVGPELSGAGMRALVRLSRLDTLAPVFADRVQMPADLAVPVLQGWLEPEGAPPPLPGVADLAITMPVPDAAARDAAWRALVPSFATWSEPDRRTVLDGWSAHPGQLRHVALAGVTSAPAAVALLRDAATQKLEGHCEVLETPFTWEDLIVPASVMDRLRELAGEARTLPRLWDEPAIGRLFPHGRSVVALFSGPPGSGKTMTAQIIARDLGLPLMRLDLSQVVSKYIGETSQNLARVLGAVRHTDAVVFFDEADALFGKRTDVSDAHDRHANTDTDYLLQALDTWHGVALLATNRRANIDPAFVRRMRMIVDFPRAAASERERLWSRLAPVLLADRADALAPLLGRAARSIEMSGAQIKAALLTAAAAARHAEAPVEVGHVVRAIARELEKEGRGLSAREQGELLD